MAAAAAAGLGGQMGPAPLPAWRLASSAVAFSFFLCCAAAASVSGIQLESLPPPPNIKDNLNVNSCHWDVSWSPVERPSGCDLRYQSYLTVGGAKQQDSEKWSVEPFRSLLVPLGHEVAFNVGTLCWNLTTHSREFANISLSSSGRPGTGARNIRCTWHYTIKKMVCSWQRGENASLNTVYNLTYWHNRSTKFCTNYTKAGSVFHCSFDFNGPLMDKMGVSIQSSSGDIQPVCLISGIGEKNFLTKLSPPSIIHVESTGNGVFLNWSAPVNESGICYQVEVSNLPTPLEYSDSETSARITVQPKAHHSFRVRALLASLNCKNEESEWSDWSERKELDERDTTFFLLLYIFILLFVAFLTIIVLVYLKSIKLVLVPTIPDPEKFLKHMLEDQSEDLQKYPKLEEPGKEEQQTHLLEFL